MTKNIENILNETAKLFSAGVFEGYDLYTILYPEEKVNKDKRKQLKDKGWILQRHSRTNQELWILNHE